MKKQYSIGLDLLFLVLCVLFCISISSLLLRFIAPILGLNIEELGQIDPDLNLLSALFTQVGGFIGGFILYLKLTKQSFSSTILIGKPNLKIAFIVIGILLLSFPIIEILSYVNSFLKDIIPNNTFILAEQKNQLAQELLLQNHGLPKLALKLLLLAFLPAVAEELLFRGVILRKIKKASNNEHYAVNITAILFASVHLQPSNLLPMIFLASVMGYIYTRTNNLCYPILFHFIFNSTTIISIHYFGVA